MSDSISGRPGSVGMRRSLRDRIDATLDRTRRIEAFLAEEAEDFDLVVIGASRERTAASRLLAPPTFERVRDVDADVAIVDRN